MHISDNQMEKLADYTKLYINESEKDKLKKDLESILEAVKVIKNVDTQDIEPLIDIHSNINVLRDDTADNDNSSRNQELILKNAPKKKNGFIEVPKMLE